jgi:hypothetical protein
VGGTFIHHSKGKPFAGDDLTSKYRIDSIYIDFQAGRMMSWKLCLFL